MPRLKDEWPLTIFTVLAPAAVGAGVVLSWQFNRFILDPIIFPASITLFGTLAAAFVISSAHIGRKMRMPRAIFNIFKSWLSREIFLLSASSLLFLVSAGLFFFRDKYNIEDMYITYAFWLATGVGLIGIFTMQRVYVVRSVSLWTGPRAIAMFFSSVFFLGFMEAALVLHIFSGQLIGDIIWRYLHLFAFPLFFDIIQVWQLKDLRHLVTAIIYGCLRLVAYVILLQFTGRVDLVKLCIAAGLAFTGDLLVRFVFYSEYTTSFTGEVSKARLSRISPMRASGMQRQWRSNREGARP